MTSQAKQKEDWKLLLIIGGSLVAVVVTIAALAHLGSDWEAKEADRAIVPPPPAIETITAPEEVAVEPLATVQPEAVERFMIDPDADFVALGRTAYSNREWEIAVAYWQAEIDARPERAYGHYMLGLSHWKAGRLEEAVGALESAGELNGKSIKTFVNLSRVRNEQGEFEKALAAAESARLIDPDAPTALYLQARSLRNLGRIDDAVVALEQALAFDPEQGHAWNLLGLIDIHRGRNAEAADSLRRAAAIEPDIAYIHSNLGRALGLNGQYAEAANSYRTAMALDPGDPGAAICLARMESKISEPAPVEPAGDALASVNEESLSESGL